MNKLGKKDFKGWIIIKEKIHYEQKLQLYKEGEIWWCRIGENVGNEICGKGKKFIRPVLVARKLSKTNFIGVPLTSQPHKGTWYVEFDFKGNREYAVVAQVENMSVYRMHHKFGEVPESDLNKVINGLRELLLRKK